MTTSDDLKTIGTGWYWDEFIIGDKFRTVGKTLTHADIINFVNSTTLHEVLFTNKVYVEEKSLLKGKFAPGPLIYLMSETLILPSIQETALAFLNLEMTGKQPLYVGDTFHVEVEVISTRVTKAGNRGVVETLNHVVNQNGEVVQIYKPTRLIKGRNFTG